MTMFMQCILSLPHTSRVIYMYLWAIHVCSIELSVLCVCVRVCVYMYIDINPIFANSSFVSVLVLADVANAVFEIRSVPQNF